MVYQLVAGRQLWRGKGVDREYMLAKLQEFHRLHKTAIDESVRQLTEAFEWLPKSAYVEEGKPLVKLVQKKRRGPKHIGELLTPLLIRMGVLDEEIDASRTSGKDTVETQSEVDLQPSEARS